MLSIICKPFARSIRATILSQFNWMESKNGKDKFEICTEPHRIAVE